MTEPKMNYNRYLVSLKNTPLPDNNCIPLQINYKALVQYAHEIGVPPCDLTEAEKTKFIIQ